MVVDVFISLVPITAFIENAVQSIGDIHGFNHTGIQQTQATLPAADTASFISTSSEFLQTSLEDRSYQIRKYTKELVYTLVDKMPAIRKW